MSKRTAHRKARGEGGGAEWQSPEEGQLSARKRVLERKAGNGTVPGKTS